MNGPSHSHYVVFHSSSSLFDTAHIGTPRGKVLHLQEFNGSSETTLLTDVHHYGGRSMLVLCSHSLGDEDYTTSALYQVCGLSKSAIFRMKGSMTHLQHSRGPLHKTFTRRKTLVILTRVFFFYGKVNGKIMLITVFRFYLSLFFSG